MSWLQTLAAGLAGAGREGIAHIEEKRAQARQDEKDRMEREFRDRQIALQQEGLEIQRGSADVARRVSEAGLARDAANQAFGVASRYAPDAELPPELVAALRAAHAPLTPARIGNLPAQASLPGVEGPAAPPSDPTLNPASGARRGWQTEPEMARAEADRVLAEQLGFIQQNVPEQLRWAFEAQARRLPTQHIGGLSVKTPEEIEAEKDADATRQIRVAQASAATAGSGRDLVMGTGADGKPTMGVVDLRTGVFTPVTTPEGFTPAPRTGSAATASAKPKEVAAIDTILDSLTDIERQGELTGWKGTGPVAGPWGERMSKWGVGDASDDEVVFRAMLGKQFSDIAKERGGSALTAQEIAVIERFAPSASNSAAQNKANVLVVKQTLENARRRQYEAAGKPYQPYVAPSRAAIEGDPLVSVQAPNGAIKQYPASKAREVIENAKARGIVMQLVVPGGGQ